MSLFCWPVSLPPLCSLTLTVLPDSSTPLTEPAFAAPGHMQSEHLTTQILTMWVSLKARGNRLEGIPVTLCTLGLLKCQATFWGIISEALSWKSTGAQGPIQISFFSFKLAVHNALLGYRNSPCLTHYTTVQGRKFMAAGTRGAEGVAVPPDSRRS